MFDWDRAFANTNVNEEVFILKKTILNIFSNFIPHETLAIDDKDPTWFTKERKTSKRKTMFIKSIKIVKTATIDIT